MATVSPNAEFAAHLVSPQMSSHSEPAAATEGKVIPVARRSSGIQLWLPVLCMIGLFGVAVLAHAALASKLKGQTEGWLVEKGFELDTNLFMGIGSVFLVQAIMAHVWVVRRLRSTAKSNAPMASGAASTSPLTLLAVPMAIRLATTFATIAYLLVTTSASRDEAVCMVLFWYIALTTLEVAAIVWAQQPAKSLVMSHPNAHE